MGVKEQGKSCCAHVEHIEPRVIGESASDHSFHALLVSRGEEAGVERKERKKARGESQSSNFECAVTLHYVCDVAATWPNPSQALRARAPPPMLLGWSPTPGSLGRPGLTEPQDSLEGAGRAGQPRKSGSWSPKRKLTKAFQFLSPGM